MRKSFIIKIVAVLATLTAGAAVPAYSNLETSQKLVQNQETTIAVVSHSKEIEDTSSESNQQNVVAQGITDVETSIGEIVADNLGQSDDTIEEETIENQGDDTSKNEQEVTAADEYTTAETGNRCNRVEVITKKVCLPTVNPGTSGNHKPETTQKQTTERQTTKNETTTTKVTGDVSSNTYVQQVVDLVNQERAKNGLNPLTLDTNLQKAAQIRAKEIEKSFSHTRPDGSNFSTVLSQLNISYRGSGENIAWGQTSPEAVMNAWMNSSGHRANILNSRFTKIGVGYYQNSAGRKYWSQLFTY